MINKVFLLGNLGSDPQVKFTKDGVMMVIFRVATNEFIRRNGTYEKVTDWHTVRVFGKLAEFCSKLKKGDRVFIEGKLKSSSFEIDNKIFRVSTVIAKSVKLIPQGITKEEIDIDSEIYNNEDGGIDEDEELPF
jgi:single-strand DNA-binding protein